MSENEVWVSGSEGVIIRYQRTNARAEIFAIQGLEQAEIRSIFAWDSKNAVVATAGRPACIYKTTNSGVTWREAYRSGNANSFYNGMVFMDDKRGVVFGDAIQGRIEILTTQDGGDSWQFLPAVQSPAMQLGEGGFAASNSSMLFRHIGQTGEDRLWIGLGGGDSSTARILKMKIEPTFPTDTHWDWEFSLVTPMRRGNNRGIFSVAASTNKLIAVGGDHQQAFEREGTIGISEDWGANWRACRGNGLRGYRSSIVFNSVAQKWISTGPNGTDISEDGETWSGLSEVGFHALSVSPDGTLWAAGSNGMIGRIEASTLRNRVVR